VFHPEVLEGLPRSYRVPLVQVELHPLWELAGLVLLVHRPILVGMAEMAAVLALRVQAVPKETRVVANTMEQAQGAQRVQLLSEMET
jgi:hypothetical protein